MDKVILEMAQSLCEKKEEKKILDAYRKALDIVQALIIVISMDKKLVFMNAYARKETGRNTLDYKECLCEELKIAGRQNDTCAFNRLQNGETFTYFHWNNEDYGCEAAFICDNLNNKLGVVEYIVPQNKDIHHLNLERELFNKSRYDELTKLFKKDYFYEQTRQLLDYHPEKEYVLVFWNVNRFKVINDVFSSHTGNMVLISISDKIKKLMGKKGTAARLHDDKFVFCIPKAKLKEQWLIENATLTLISDTSAYTFKSTFGIYEVTDRTISIDIMCDRAKMAQQTVAEFHLANGKPFAYYDRDLRMQMVEEQYLITQMSYALQEGQFRVYLQPVYDIKTSRIVSAEALVRWLHPEKGLIPPAKFIGVFEKNGLITQLDRYIWNKIGKMIENRLANKESCVPISINVSRVDFFTTTFLEDMDEIIKKYNIPKNMMRVEVTETAYSDDPNRIMSIVRQLRVRGFSVLLDDFGSGYSSFNTLKDIPLDVLKIDMQFISNLEKSKRAGCVLESIVTMANRLNMEIIAEGVETVAQADFLLKIGCRNVQGYLYAKPMPMEEFLELLDKPPFLTSAIQD